MNFVEAMAIKYYLQFGDLKPSELGIKEGYYCPECKGCGEIIIESCDGRGDQIRKCQVCKGFGVFDHKPEAISKIIGYK